MRVLIVEDDPRQVERYNDSIEAFNAERQTDIRPEYRDNLEEGLKALMQDYDGAVIDLKLSGGTESAEGNLIVKEIKKNKRFPVCILTGYPQDLDADLKEEIERGPNLFFWLEKRDRPFQDVLDRLSTVYRSGVVEIVGPHGVIDEALHKIFWSHLAKTLSFWNAQTESTANRKQRLVRFILSHLLSKLETSDEGDLDDSYPDEMYVIPPFREQWQTGDIIKREESETYFVILTPACDLAQSKAKSIQIVEVESVIQMVEVEGFQAGVMLNELNSYRSLTKKLTEEGRDKALINEDRGKQAKVFDNLLKLTRNSYATRYHFLPPCQTFPGGVLNFQKVNSVPLKEFSKRFTKTGTITTGFLKDIVSRFAGYYARQGQPSFDCEKLVDELTKQD
jgi:CheY-like chemotaxis protein